MAEEWRRLAAIMFTDIVGYSARAQADEAGGPALLERHDRLLRPIFAKFHGRERTRSGPYGKRDGILTRKLVSADSNVG